MCGAKEWFVDDNLFGGRTQIVEQHNFVRFKATHIFVRIVTAGAQEIGTIVATRHGILFALTRRTGQRTGFDGDQIQNVGQHVVGVQGANAFFANLSVGGNFL